MKYFLSLYLHASILEDVRWLSLRMPAFRTKDGSHFDRLLDSHQQASLKAWQLGPSGRWTSPNSCDPSSLSYTQGPSVAGPSRPSTKAQAHPLPHRHNYSFCSVENPPSQPSNHRMHSAQTRAQSIQNSSSTWNGFVSECSPFLTIDTEPMSWNGRGRAGPVSRSLPPSSHQCLIS